jgi:hypothetical protein
MFPGGSCNAWVKVGGEGTRLGLPGGSVIGLKAADQNICTSFGLAKIGNTEIKFDAQKTSIVLAKRTVFSVNRVQL